MCGIAGFSGSGTHSVLATMMDTLALRGPDDAGVFYDAPRNIFLGHRRLSIIDISGGHQPMSHVDGNLHVVFNGEIYNHIELRSQLVGLGHKFITDHSDTEVLLHGYKEWGTNLSSRLNGMFAFAIYDVTNQTLFLARDRFGEKPLYFSILKNGIVFASELKAVLRHPDCPKDISKEGMKKFFAYGFVPAPSTIIASVNKLQPGYQLTYNLNTRTHSLEAYWKFKLSPNINKKANETELAEKLKLLVHQAVERRLMSDVPVGVFLSGGIDSSIVLSSVVKYKDPLKIDTFSIGFKEESFDESTYARVVSKHFGTRHHEKILNSADAREILDYVLENIDEPLGDPSILPTYLLAKFAKEHIQVALGGDGADELFAGYDPFRALVPASLYSKIVPNKLHSYLFSLISKLKPSDKNMSLDFRLKRTLRGLSYKTQLWNPVWLGPICPKEIESLFGEVTDSNKIYSESIEDWFDYSDYSLEEHTLSFYTNIYLPNNILTKVDRASMLVSLESRAPFLDNDLVSFIETLPTNLKINGMTTKYLLKQAFKTEIPEAIIKRPKKGFGIPLSTWLRSWNDSSFIDNLPFIDKKLLKQKWAEHKDMKADHRQLFWCVISLSKFIQSLRKF